MVRKVRLADAAVLLQVLILLTMAWLLVGCGAQDVDSRQKIASEQAQVTPTTTTQDQATAGSQVYVYNTVNYYPDSGSGSLPADGVGPPYGMSPEALVMEDAAAAPGGGNLKNTRAGYVLAGLSFGPINITTGGTTPSVSGTTTGTATSSQTPTVAQTTSPDQRTRGEVSAAVPIGVAANGGQVDQQATATGRGTTSDTAKTSENQLTYTEIKAAADRLEQLLNAAKALAPAPVVPPVPDVPQIPQTQPAGEVVQTDGAGS